MLSKTMIEDMRGDAYLSINILADEMENLRDALIEMTEQRDHWKERCEKLEAANAQEAE